MANIKLAIETVAWEIDTIEELIRLAESGALVGHTLVVESDHGEDEIYLQGGAYTLNPLAMDFIRADAVHIMFKNLMERAGLRVHLT